MQAVWSVEGARLVARTVDRELITSWIVGDGIEVHLLASMFNQAPAVGRLVLWPWIGDEASGQRPAPSARISALV